MSTQTQSDQRADWGRVRDAIIERFPQIHRAELALCPNEVHELTQFVKQRVDASDDEVAAVVHEFAPPASLPKRVAHAASETLNHASESAQFAYMRADECIARRPTESVLTSFVAGIILGATVTALVMHSKPQPSAWGRMKDRVWS